VCGGIISSDKTLIPFTNWTPGDHQNVNLLSRLFNSSPHFDMYANYAVYLCARVLNLFAKMKRHATGSQNDQCVRAWSTLFDAIEDWYKQRPEEMTPILDLPYDEKEYTRPFPVILFSNAPAGGSALQCFIARNSYDIKVSGNQLYHTAALLMQQSQPYTSDRKRQGVSNALR
jgi:hypothetical protein